MAEDEGRDWQFIVAWCLGWGLFLGLVAVLTLIFGQFACWMAYDCSGFVLA